YFHVTGVQTCALPIYRASSNLMRLTSIAGAYPRARGIIITVHDQYRCGVMCGITGEIRFNGAADIAAVTRMMSVLGTRGPDGGGLVSYNKISFGHRRLKVIDLSDCAAQPMFDAELGLCIVFNGCIYDHLELRKELEGKGYRFFSKGDTEVILKAWHCWGPDCLQRFHGMFAFVIWERESGRVFAARDRLGIKPLYYAEIDDGLRFASTLPALLQAGGVDTSIDPVALHHYMSFHSVVPAPHTILRGVRKLPPATWLCIDAEGNRRQETWWRVNYEHDEPERSFEEWRSEEHTSELQSRENLVCRL